MRKQSALNTHETSLLAQVRSLLMEENPAEARSLLASRTNRSSEETNAMGVCLIRLGKYAEAVQLFRALVLPGGGVVTPAHIPIAWKLNFASALLGDGNFDGFLNALSGIQAEDHPEARRLHDAYSNWKNSLTFGQKLLWRLGASQPATIPSLPLMPGTLEMM